MSKLQTLLLASAAAMVVAAAASSASAAVLIERDFDGNDCAGFFGQPFEACTIFIDEGDEEIELSPVIAKIDFDDDGNPDDPETNGLYPTIDGGEFTFTGTDGGSGTWTYTPDDADDPGVRYWVAKAGNDFRLHWVVDDADYGAGAACDPGGDFYNLACLEAALVVTQGTWSSPGGKDSVSHLTWYDTERVDVPEPATLGLLGIGLLGAGYWARRRLYDA